MATKATGSKTTATKTTTTATKKTTAPKTVEKKENKEVCSCSLFLQEVTGEVNHELTKKASSWGEDEYVFKGKLAKGKVRFVTGKNLEKVVPSNAGEDHGYTLEGKAQELFKVSKALDVYNEQEQRSFHYINNKSTLEFVGDPKVEVSLYVRVYDNKESNRWVVIYAE